MSRISQISGSQSPPLPLRSRKLKEVREVTDISPSTIIKPNANLFITPISKTYKAHGSGACSRRDWDEQLERENNGEQVMWDGPSKNYPKPTAGDLMSVWHHNKFVKIYVITEVHDPGHRLPSWTQNIGQSDRVVVYLACLHKIDWDTWISIGGHKRCMGTSLIKTHAEPILAHIQDQIKKNTDKK